MKKLSLLLLLFVPFSLSKAEILSVPDLGNMAYVTDDPEWPVELISVRKVNYPRNKKATFCVRPPEMVDTLVIHHSETSSTSTAEYINQIHLNRGSANDPWYMIAYSYVINSPYAGGTIPKPLVTEGRPMDIVGAHAGSNIFVPMSEDQKKIWASGKILCGNDTIGFKHDPSLVKNGKVKANVTTAGVVINGNYSPFSRTNPGGYSRTRPRYPTKPTQQMIAKLFCQLQKKYPRMKNIKWHNYYHATSCPGTIKSYIGQIKTLAKGYGCEFN